jgi:hypothetical protein
MFDNLSGDLFKKNIKEVPRSQILRCLIKRVGDMKISRSYETHALTRDIMNELQKSRNCLISIEEFEAAA